MTETVFRTTKASIKVFRSMIDEATQEHETALKRLKSCYIGTKLTEMRNRENEEYTQRTDDLRNAAYSEICNNIKSVRDQIFSKVQKRDFKALNELSTLSNLHLSQAEFNLLYKQYSNNNYWNIRKLSEIAQKQGLEMPEPFAPIDKQFSALDQLEENCKFFIMGCDKESGEIFNKYGHIQQFSGYGSSDGKSGMYEQMLCVSDAEFNRLESLYSAENPLFTEGALVDDIVKGLAAVDGSMNKLHYLNNRLNRMTKEQVVETVSRLSESSSNEVQLALSLSDFSSVIVENAGGKKNG